jgi:hypothetical protein
MDGLNSIAQSFIPHAETNFDILGTRDLLTIVKLIFCFEIEVLDKMRCG